MFEFFVNTTSLSKKHRTALRRAVYEAAAWRGSLTGSDGTLESENDETNRLTEFDQFIHDACEALKVLGINPSPGTKSEDSYV